MEWVYINKIGSAVGSEVTIKGWLYNKRSSGKIHFLMLRDGTGIVQAVAAKDALPPEVFAECERVAQESSIIATGVVREEKRAPGGYELDLRTLKILQLAENYPITKKEHGTEFLMDNRHLWIRSRKQQSILRVRAEIVRAIRDFFDERDFVLIDSPILTPSSVEGTTTLFQIDYFGETAYLSQSGQLYQEPACMALGKVYCFGPTFRAEKSKTRRHLLEFWMVEPEVAFATFEDIVLLGEGLVCAVVERVLERRREDLKVLERDVAKLEKVRAPFPRISYTEAVEKLRESGTPVEWGNDFGAPEETTLCNLYEKPVVVHRFPAAIKAFYMQPDPEDSRLVLGADFLAPEGYGEIIGGGERIADHDLLLKRLREHGLPQKAYQWYLDIRKYGSVQHAGFGLGLERTVAWICGLSHIRETIPYPRMLYRLYP